MSVCKTKKFCSHHPRATTVEGLMLKGQVRWRQPGAVDDPVFSLSTKDSGAISAARVLTTLKRR